MSSKLNIRIIYGNLCLSSGGGVGGWGVRTTQNVYNMVYKTVSVESVTVFIFHLFGFFYLKNFIQTKNHTFSLQAVDTPL